MKLENGGMSVPPHPDIYWKQDWPVLLAIAQWDLSTPGPKAYTTAQIADRLGIERAEAVASIGRLGRAGFVEIDDISTMGTEDYWARRLTERGLRKVGAWPRQEQLAAALLEVLQKETAEMERSDPEKGRRLRAILEAAANAGTDILAKVSAELVKSQLGVR